MNWSFDKETLKYLWDKLDLQYKVAIFVACVALLIGFFISSVIIPQWDRIAALRNALKVEQVQVAGIISYVEHNSDLDKQYVELRQKLDQTSLLLPEQSDIGSFLVQLEQVAKASKVVLGQVQPAQPVSRTGYYEIPVTITVSGNYFQVLDFMSRIEGMKRFVAVSSMSLKPKTGDVLDGNIAVIIYASGQASGTVPQPGTGGKIPAGGQRQ